MCAWKVKRRSFTLFLTIDQKLFVNLSVGIIMFINRIFS